MVKKGFITNKIYAEINKVSNKTASLELKNLEKKRLLEVQGKAEIIKQKVYPVKFLFVFNWAER